MVFVTLLLKMNILIINAHQYYSYSEGKLNQSLIELANNTLTEKGHLVKITTTSLDYDLDEEVEKHLWADHIIIQSPVNWMGITWSFKKYIDEVISHGRGKLWEHDGRVLGDVSKQYGTGGLLTNKTYSLSLTFNAPKMAFNDVSQVFFKGKSVDDLFLPLHLTYQFLGMKNATETFVCYDVVKNPTIEQDLKNYKEYLIKNF